MAFDALYIILPVAAAIFGAGGGVFVKNIYDKNSAESKVAKADEMVKKMITDAQKRAETLKKETILEAKEEVYRLKTENERESKERRSELQRAERRLQQKEESFDKKQDTLEQREQQLAKRIKAIDAKEASVSKLYDAQQQELERVAGMTQDEAKDVLLNNVEKEARHEAALIIRDIESKAKAEADRRAVNIISMAIQRCAADHVAESTVSVVALPNDEMKGRIIGREGRNIRTLETATGVDLIIDDTPEAVILSGFDPMRREVARIALEKLILDGRIHPARIEEMVEKARKEVETQIREAGEQAVFESGVHGLHHELVRLLGRLRYRTSYGQNVLKHSIEVSHLAGLMATELGVNVQLAKRAGLLHDIGKAVDHEVEGMHNQSARILQRNIAKTTKLFTAFLHTTAMLNPERLRLFSFRRRMQFPQQGRAQGVKPLKITSSVLKSLRKSPIPLTALTRALRFRRAAKSASWSSPIPFRIRILLLSQKTSSSALNPSLNIPDRSRSMLFAKPVQRNMRNNCA